LKDGREIEDSKGARSVDRALVLHCKPQGVIERRLANKNRMQQGGVISSDKAPANRLDKVLGRRSTPSKDAKRTMATGKEGEMDDKEGM